MKQIQRQARPVLFPVPVRPATIKKRTGEGEAAIPEITFTKERLYTAMNTAPANAKKTALPGETEVDTKTNHLRES